MARTSKAQRLADIHSAALAEFDDVQKAAYPERIQALKDRRFYSIAGAQWEGEVGDQFENKPRFEFNKVHLALIRIFSEYRNNRITVDFQPKDGASNDKLADICDGLFRADERSCSADEAYDNAFEEAVGGGMGAWRLRACYENEDDDEDDRQRIRMEPIFDAESCVFFNLGAKRYDKSDAQRCWVLTPYPLAQYKEEFGDNPADWPKDVTQREFDWATDKIVWVCEFYRVEEETELVYFYRGLDEEAEDMRVTAAELEADPEMEGELLATGFKRIREKKLRSRRVMKYLMSGGKMLNDGERIPGKCIPIIPVYGKRWVVDGVERIMGHVRLAKDAQRLSNMLMSWLAEMASRFGGEKPIFSPEQIQRHAQMWADDNIQNYAYLMADMVKDPVTGQPVPGSQAPAAYTRAPNIPPATAALMQLAEQALTDLLGNQHAGEEMKANISGKVVELVQQRLDMQVFIYVSNLAKSHKRAGEVWLSMARELLVEDGRKMKAVSAQGETSSVELNRDVYDAETGEVRTENDLSVADFEVDVDVGPSSATKKQATVRSLTGLRQVTQDPETASILDAAILMNTDGEGLSGIRQYMRRKLVRMGVEQPTEEERQELEAAQANAKPDPQSAALLGMAEEAQAKAAEARAKTVETIASADLKRAQTAKTLAETEGERNGQILASAQALQQMLAPPGQI